MGQLKSLEQRLQDERYQKTIDTDVNAGYVRKVDQTELNETRNRPKWYLQHHPVIPSHKPGSQKSMQRSSKVLGVALIYKLLSGPLQSLVGKIFCFREHQIALSADIEAMFLQINVPSDDSRCLQFLRRKH